MDSELKNKVNELENKIDELKNKINNLKYENKELKKKLTNSQDDFDYLMYQINLVNDNFNEMYENVIPDLFRQFELFNNEDLNESLINKCKNKNSLQNINNNIQNIGLIIYQIICDARNKKQ